MWWLPVYWLDIWRTVKEETEKGISLREHAGLQKDYEKLQEEYQSVKKINGELQNKIFELLFTKYKQNDIIMISNKNRRDNDERKSTE